MGDDGPGSVGFLIGLSAGSRIAVPRHVPSPVTVRDIPEPELVMLAHLLGDGSFVRNQPIRYANTHEADLALFGLRGHEKFVPIADDAV